jgi:hypothetical protein
LSDEPREQCSTPVSDVDWTARVPQ